MGTANGTVLGTTKIVDHGPATQRFNLLILSEGYRSTEMAQFAADAQQFADTLFATRPYDVIQAAINIFRVDVASDNSGAADPAACGGTGAIPHTYFDASFCNNGIQRLLEVDNTTVLSVASAQVPQWHVALVIVNSTIYGGSGGAVATFSKAAGAMEIALHEMGHTAFGFADEYEYYAGYGVDVGHDHHPGTEPSQPNVTIDPNRDTIKWGSMILPGSHAHDEQCGLLAVRPPAEPRGHWHGRRVRRRGLLPLRQLPAGIQLSHEGAWQPVLHGLSKGDRGPFDAVSARTYVADDLRD